MTAKTCRSCIWSFFVLTCPVLSEIGKACSHYVEREMPLLEDELAEALNGLLALCIDATDTGVAPDVYYSSDEVMRVAFAAVARYQKEVDDA